MFQRDSFQWRNLYVVLKKKKKKGKREINERSLI